MVDKKLMNICFGDFHPYIQKIIEYKVTNGLGFPDSFDQDIYRPLFNDEIESISLQIHLGLMSIRQFELEKNLRYQLK